MSFQVKAVVLYKERRNPRVIRFKEGINVVSGEPNTGKSTLIHIIDYCLGRSAFGVYAGVTRETVDWYAVLLQINDSQVFIAKPSPSSENPYQSLAHLEIDTVVVVPQSSEVLEARYSAREVTTKIFRLMNPDPSHNTGSTEVLQDVEIGIDQTLFYLFQEKSVIANNQVLFHRQRNNADVIRRTLPFFLGIRKQEDLRAQQQLKQAQEKASSLRSKLNWEEKRFSFISEMRQGLLAETQRAGLIESDFVSEDPEVINKALREVAAKCKLVTSEQADGRQLSDLPPVEDSRIPYLQSERNDLYRQFERKEWEIQRAKSFVRSTHDYSDAVREQQVRLESIGLLRTQDGLFDNICPLCDSALKISPPQVSEVRKSLENLRDNLAQESMLVPSLESAISQLHKEASRIKRKIRQIELEIQTIMDRQEVKKNAIQSILLANVEVERTVGRIQLYLDLVEDIDNLHSLQEQLRRVEVQVEEYKKEYNPKIIETRQKRILDSIGAQMSSWATKLHMEHQGLYHLDLENLTVVVETPRRTIPMEQMGGRSNWLGCHLITLLALHQHFMDLNRPVPSFLILDQPTQGYFPSPDEYVNTYHPRQMRLGELDLPSNYMEAIEEMFEFLFDVCENLPGFQLIILERAQINTEKFIDSLVDGRHWDSNSALIPLTWIKEAHDDKADH